MSRLPASVTPEEWLNHLFCATAARDRGVERRKLRDIERFLCLEPFEHEVARRGYRAVRNGAEVIVFFNRTPIRSLVGGNSFEGNTPDFSKNPRFAPLRASNPCQTATVLGETDPHTKL